MEEEWEERERHLNVFLRHEIKEEISESRSIEFLCFPLCLAIRHPILIPVMTVIHGSPSETPIMNPSFSNSFSAIHLVLVFSSLVHLIEVHTNGPHFESDNNILMRVFIPLWIHFDIIIFYPSPESWVTPAPALSMRKSISRLKTAQHLYPPDRNRLEGH